MIMVCFEQGHTDKDCARPGVVTPMVGELLHDVIATSYVLARQQGLKDPVPHDFRRMKPQWYFKWH
jgi:hypothetical protein